MLNCRGMGDHWASSPLRRMPRDRLRPHDCFAPDPYRSVEKGMRNSAYQPAESREVRTVQLASQLRLKPPIDPDCARVWPVTLMPPPSPSFTIWPSYSMPAGVVAKMNPFCRSRYVSSV